MDKFKRFSTLLISSFLLITFLPDYTFSQEVDSSLVSSTDTDSTVNPSVVSAEEQLREEQTPHNPLEEIDYDRDGNIDCSNDHCKDPETGELNCLFINSCGDTTIIPTVFNYAEITENAFTDPDFSIGKMLESSTIASDEESWIKRKKAIEINPDAVSWEKCRLNFFPDMNYAFIPLKLRTYNGPYERDYKRYIGIVIDRNNKRVGTGSFKKSITDNDTRYRAEFLMDSGERIEVEPYKENLTIIEYKLGKNRPWGNLTEGPSFRKLTDILTFAIIKNYTLISTNPDTGDCAGYLREYELTVSVENKSEPDIPYTELYFEVVQLPHGNILGNADTPGGPGSILTVSKTGDYADGLLGLNNIVEVTFTVCLKKLERFTLLLELYGKESIYTMPEPIQEVGE